MKDLVELEEQGWQALSAGGEAAKEFYGSLLADNAVMVFPGGMLIEGKEEILDSLDAQPWNSFQMEDPRVILASEDVRVIVYEVAAKREGREAYVAHMSSTYAFREGEWELVFHQQTPM